MQPKRNKKEKVKDQEQHLILTPKTKRITSIEEFTPDYLRSFPGLETLSDPEAMEAIESMKAFAQLTFSQYTSIYGQP